MNNEWRRLVAALADESRRELYAHIVLGVYSEQEPRSKKRERALTSLASAGLIAINADGSVTADGAVFDRLLAAGASPVRQGIERFLRNGRIEQYPARPADRDELLGWVVARALPENERLSEAQVNDRLEHFSDDVATLRRYLVDAGLLRRDAAGRTYERSAASS